MDSKSVIDTFKPTEVTTSELTPQQDLVMLAHEKFLAENADLLKERSRKGDAARMWEPIVHAIGLARAKALDAGVHRIEIMQALSQAIGDAVTSSYMSIFPSITHDQAHELADEWFGKTHERTSKTICQIFSGDKDGLKFTALASTTKPATRA